MPSTIELAIRAEAAKIIRRHEIYMTNLARDLHRRESRSGLPQKKVIQIPSYWSVDRGFDPYYVRRHAKAIARTMERKLADRSYQPRPAYKYSVPKGGGTRDISVFQIADSALSFLTFKRLMAKNSRHFSASAYAYRADLSVHDAILHIGSELRTRNRVYLAEFDFTKFFESISHEHLLRMLDDRRFFVTQRERFVIRTFLSTPSLSAEKYKDAFEPRTNGIPQGTSISLFLANLAAYPLDRRLERLGVGFARYADDTLIWSDSYAEIGRAANALEETGSEIGVSVSFIKSKGITLLSPAGMAAEFSTQNSVDFLGYKISQDHLSIRKDSVSRIKNHIGFLIYKNLLQEPKRGNVPSGRMLQGIDQDYPVLIYQLRRYLYGEMSEAMLRKFLVRQIPKLRFKGLMSFYPIVDDEDLLKELDGWMLSCTLRAIRLRGTLWSSYYPGALPTPHGKSRAQLLQLRHNPGAGPLVDLRFPSFLRMSRLLRRASVTYGPSAIANAKSSKYYSPTSSLATLAKILSGP
jgi:RNA-directed DNA polymerase